MGCQCANKEEENKSEILKEINEDTEQNQDYNNDNYNSNSKEGIFGLDQQNPEETQEKFSEKQNNEIDINENNQDKNLKYSDYPQKMLDLINQIRANPSSYADVIEDSI